MVLDPLQFGNASEQLLSLDGFGGQFLPDYSALHLKEFDLLLLFLKYYFLDYELGLEFSKVFLVGKVLFLDVVDLMGLIKVYFF